MSFGSQNGEMFPSADLVHQWVDEWLLYSQLRMLMKHVNDTYQYISLDTTWWYWSNNHFALVPPWVIPIGAPTTFNHSGLMYVSPAQVWAVDHVTDQAWIPCSAKTSTDDESNKHLLSLLWHLPMGSPQQHSTNLVDFQRWQQGLQAKMLNLSFNKWSGIWNA